MASDRRCCFSCEKPDALQKVTTKGYNGLRKNLVTCGGEEAKISRLDTAWTSDDAWAHAECKRTIHNQTKSAKRVSSPPPCKLIQLKRLLCVVGSKLLPIICLAYAASYV